MYKTIFNQEELQIIEDFNLNMNDELELNCLEFIKTLLDDKDNLLGNLELLKHLNNICIKLENL